MSGRTLRDLFHPRNIRGVCPFKGWVYMWAGCLSVCLSLFPLNKSVDPSVITSSEDGAFPCGTVARRVGPGPCGSVHTNLQHSECGFRALARLDFGSQTAGVYPNPKIRMRIGTHAPLRHLRATRHIPAVLQPTRLQRLRHMLPCTLGSFSAFPVFATLADWPASTGISVPSGSPCGLPSSTEPTLASSFDSFRSLGGLRRHGGAVRLIAALLRKPRSLHCA